MTEAEVNEEIRAARREKRERTRGLVVRVARVEPVAVALGRAYRCWQAAWIPRSRERLAQVAPTMELAAAVELLSRVLLENFISYVASGSHTGVDAHLLATPVRLHDGETMLDDGWETACRVVEALWAGDRETHP